MDSFIKIKSIIKKEENYVKRKSETIGGMWTVESWEKDDIVFSIMDEGYIERIYVKDTLEVIKRYDNRLVFKLGTYEDLVELEERLGWYVCSII